MKLASLALALVVGLLLAAGAALAAGGVTVVKKTARVPGVSAPGSVNEKTVTARCPKGRSAVAGGFDSEFEPLDYGRRAIVLDNVPAGARAWSAVGVAGTPEGGEVTTSALCSRTERSVVRTRSTTIPPQQTGQVRVSCPRRTRVVGIGFEGELRLVGGGAEVQTFATGALRTSQRKVLVKGLNAPIGSPDPDAGRLTGHAVCAKSPRLSTESASTIVAPGDSALVDARCGSDRKANFGGFDLRALDPESPVLTRTFFAGASQRSGPRVWQLRAVNDSESPGAPFRARSFAYCAG